MEALDKRISKSIYDVFNGTFVSSVPQIFGLIPYEMYVIPGMYVAILQVLWFGSPNPVQFHLLPHWFAYSIFQFLKKVVKRKRPGCFNKGMDAHINGSHCEGGHEYQSFPSGHTGVAFSLATALFMEMNYSNHPQFFEVPITKQETKLRISGVGLFVASMIALHRVSKGYHSFIDVLVGGILGASIGFVSWSCLEFYKKKYQEVCEKQKRGDELCDNYEKAKDGKEYEYWVRNYHIFRGRISKEPRVNQATGVARVVLTVPIVYLLAKFFMKDVFHLATLKH